MGNDVMRNSRFEKLYVGNLTLQDDENQIRELFSNFGDVESVERWETYSGVYCACVTFHVTDPITTAIQNRPELNGRRVLVKTWRGHQQYPSRYKFSHGYRLRYRKRPY